MVSVAVELVLVASTRNCCLETMYSARVMATVSAAGDGAAGVTVSNADLVTPPKLAEIVAEVDAVTDTVVTVNVALAPPAGTVTLPTAGTLAAAGLLLERVTTAPPAGAAALSVTVATEELPPTTLVGFSTKPETVRGGGGAGGVTVSRAEVLPVAIVVVIVTVVDTVTGKAEAVNVALLLPARTVTLAGIVAARVLLLESPTVTPPAGAGAANVTVPSEEEPLATLAGLSASAESVTGGGGAGGETVSSAVLVRPPKEAAIVMVVDAVTEVVVTVKLAVVDPAATVTLAGTVATTVLLLERITAVAAEGAGLMLTVPCKVLPPATVAGVSMTLLRAGGALGVQPTNVACAELPPPFTVTIQVSELKGCTWILKAPAPSEVPSAAPSTKMTWLGRAPLPSRRSWPAFSSARVIVGGRAGGATVSPAVRVAVPSDAMMVTGVDAVTELAVTVKLAPLAPPGMVTLAATLATDVLLLERVTSAPPAGAPALKVTVPAEDVGPTTLVGFSAKLESVTGAGGGGGGVTLSRAVIVVVPSMAEMVTGVDAVTDTVVTVNVALVAPATIVTLAGTLATAALLLESDTNAPPLGAAEVSVTVPVEPLPPTRLEGLNVSDDNVAAGGGGASGFTVKVADWVTPPPETEIVTTVCTVTGLVKMLKPPVVTPAGIMTLLFTEATAGWLLVS